MKLRFLVKNSIFDTVLQITDGQGTRRYRVSAMEGEEAADQLTALEVNDPSFELTLWPEMPDMKGAVDEMEAADWKEKLAKKALHKLLSMVEEAPLRVGCSYQIRGVPDGKTVQLDLQGYAFGFHFWAELLDLFPVMYLFYEASYHGERFAPVDAFEINRRAVVGSAKKLALMQLGLSLIITYPLQVGWVKRLARNKKIFKTLLRFHRMDETKRKKLLEKMEK